MPIVIGAPDGYLDDRPNIVLILVDDQRHDAFGRLTPGLNTPSLDRLLDEGVHFSNAFVTTSLCSPSRASILSGQTMRSHGIVDNNSPTPPRFEPFSVPLNEAGYATAFIGKWHMGNSDASPKPGFDHWVSFEGQGSYAPTDAFGRPAMFNVNGEQVPRTDYITDELTRHAVTWLGAQREEPFFMLLSHKAAHLPFTPAERHAGQYDDLVIKQPASASQQSRRGPRPMWLTSQHNSWHGSGFAFYSDRPVDEFRRDYYATLSAVDDSVGALLDAVAALDTARDTVIIYTSDNGFMFGEHGLVDKRAAYEASIRVPMIIHAPNRFAGGVDNRVIARNIDIAPTILSLAGLAVPPHYEGRDLLGAAADTDEVALVYEYYWEFNYPQTPTTFALRTNGFKYIQYHGIWDTEELFDLVEDPEETVNLVSDASHQERLIKMRAELYAELSDGGERPAVPFSQRFNQGAVFWNREVSSRVEFPPHWQRDAGADDKYEHVLPDGAGKEGQLQLITPVLRGVLDGPDELDK